MLVNFEGLDGSGKSTLLKEIHKLFPSAKFTKEPGSSLIPINLKIREMVLHNEDLSPLQRELLFYTDALGHRDLIEKSPEAFFLSDRGIWSHYAYLHGYMRLEMLGEDPDLNYTRYGLCKKLIKQACAEPDAIIYLEGSVQLMQQRLHREKDSIERLPTEYFVHVLACYDDLCIAAEFERKPLLILDAKAQVEENVARTVNFLGDLQRERK